MLLSVEIPLDSELLLWESANSVQKNSLFRELNKISWGQIIPLVFLFLFVVFLNERFKSKRPVKIGKAFIGNILERFFALLGYFLPLVVVYSSYVVVLLPSYPFLNLIVPEFMRVAIKIYSKYPLYLNFGYFFGVIFLCLKFRLPKPRFIRFHMVRGIMLLAFQSIPELIFQFFLSSNTINPDQRTNIAMFILVINLFWFLPCLYQAVTYTYPRSSFMRDAIEINVGRDNEEGFKWWNK